MNGRETADCDDSWREETGKKKSCFCRHSFARPRIYNFLFFSPEGSKNLNEVFRKYYEISEPEIKGLNEMSVLIYRGMLAIMQSDNDKPTVEEAVRKTVGYLGKALDAYQLK